MTLGRFLPKVFELLDRTGSKTGVVIVEKSVSLNPFIDDLFELLDPNRHLRRFGFDLFPITDKARVDKIAGEEIERFGEIVDARHPGLRHQREGDRVVAQQFEEIPADPIFVANLQGKLEVLGQAFEKRLEQPLEGSTGRKYVLIEVRKLQQQRSQPVAENFHILQESREFILTISEHLLMRNRAWNLCGEYEVRWSFVAPGGDHIRRRSAVVGRIDFDGAKFPRVGFDKLPRFEIDRIKRTEPVAAGPARGAE